jgi:hypothetical protein
MIRTALEFIKKELETYMVEREQDPANYSVSNAVVLKPLVAPDGAIDTGDSSSHVTVILVGVEEELREGKRPYFIPTDDKKYFKLNPPVELNLFILFVAHNGDYKTALRDLSDVIGFFQSNQVFESTKFPALNATVSQPDAKPWQLIERLCFKLHNLTFEQQNNLWATMGAKYMPSVMYKMNMLTVFETKSKEKAAPITELNFPEK